MQCPFIPTICSSCLLPNLCLCYRADFEVQPRVKLKCHRFCAQVAEAAAQYSSNQSEDSGKHEAALYAALAGHLKQILPVCHTRADILWAYTRSWLESQVDKHLADGNDKGDVVASLRLGMDAVASTKRDHPEEVHRVVLDDVAAFWPPTRCDLTCMTSALVSLCNNRLQCAVCNAS